MTGSAEELVSLLTSTQSNTSPSKFAQTLRGSLRSLTRKSPHSGHLGRRIFPKKSASSKEPSTREDWVDDFHLVTAEDIDAPSFSLFPTASAISATSTLGVDQLSSEEAIPPKLPANPYSSLSPLVISDPLRVSTITTSDSPTPTFAEFAHLASSFPLPPSYIPVVSPQCVFPILCDSVFSSEYSSSDPTGPSASRVITHPDTTSPFTSPISEIYPGSIDTVQRIKSRARDLFRIPSFLSSLKSKS